VAEVGDAGRRFDAQALIGEFRICSALPAVRETLACWQAALEKYSDMTRDGDYGLARSQALSAVHALELLVRDLEAACQ
jgi:hypothetical protein